MPSRESPPTRRAFSRLAGAAALALLIPRPALAQGKAKVVVVGGGVGGVAAAKLLAREAALEVTLVEPNPDYVTCFFGNHYLAGLRALATLTHDYAALAQRHRVMRDLATSIDPAKKTVALAGGATLSYDRLVLAPGIAFKFDAIEGYDAAASETLPHAWSGGAQLRLLRAQIESMEDGGVFLMVVPAEPLRCPPAPYERASLVASYFKRVKPRAKIIILDANDAFVMQTLFQDGWERHTPNMIEWLPAQFTGGVQAIDVTARAVRTQGDTFRGAVVNVIPPQVAGDLARHAGLADASGWCPVDPVTFESRRQAGIHLVGDAIRGGAMPKSAVSAHSQARACAAAVATALTGARHEAPQLSAACHSSLAPDDAISTAAGFSAAGGTLAASRVVMSRLEDDAETRRRNARAAEDWYAEFTRDLFG